MKIDAAVATHKRCKLLARCIGRSEHENATIVTDLGRSISNSYR